MNQEPAAMASDENPKASSTMTYTEMMNEGRQKRENISEGSEQDLKQRVEELERKVEHLQKAIQRQIRLGRSVEE